MEYQERVSKPTYTIVGLPGASVNESRERVRSALRNSGLILSFCDK